MRGKGPNLSRKWLLRKLYHRNITSIWRGRAGSYTATGNPSNSVTHLRPTVRSSALNQSPPCPHAVFSPRPLAPHALDKEAPATALGAPSLPLHQYTFYRQHATSGPLGSRPQRHCVVCVGLIYAPGDQTVKAWKSIAIKCGAAQTSPKLLKFIQNETNRLTSFLVRLS